MILTPRQVATELADLFVCAFGGKARGRFSFSHDDLRALSGRARLEESIVDQVEKWLFQDHQLVLVDCGPVYGVIDAKKVLAWRPLPQKLVKASR